MSLFGTLGIRSVFNETLTAEFAQRIANAYGIFRNSGKIVIGYDSRTSNVLLKNAVVSGLLSCGCDVIDVGAAASPTIQWAVKKLNCAGAMVITASHNPKNYNGLKFTDSDGNWLNRDHEAQIESIFRNKKFKLVAWDEVAKVEVEPNLNRMYIDAVLDYVTPFSGANLKVVVDCANSVGSLTTPYILREMGCQVVSINSHLDGHFPGRSPEPTESNLSDLITLTRGGGFDIGIAHDGDVDRLISIDENGRFIFGDQSFALVADHVLDKFSNPKIVMPVNTSNAVRDIAKKYDTKIYETKIGELNIVDKIRDIGISDTFAGEENGGLIFPDFGSFRNGPLAAAMIIKIISEQKKSYSQLIDNLPTYKLVKENIHVDKSKISKIIDHLKGKFSDYELNTLDGVKIVFNEESWIIIRPSGTEPVIRIFSEAKTHKKASENRDKMKEEIKKVT